MVAGIREGRPARLVAGLTGGAIIAAVDNLTFGGEVSPIVIVVLLLVATATAGLRWGRRGWSVAVAIWIWVPGAHLAKRFLGLPDTLHPNTAASILLLAAFSLIVAAVGTGCGLLLRRFAVGIAKPA